MNEELRRDIDRFVEENTENIKRDIARLVAINSVEGESAPGAPFGAGPKAALDLGLQIAEELGLKSTHFAEPNGLSYENKTTARELSLILQEALQHMRHGAKARFHGRAQSAV